MSLTSTARLRTPTLLVVGLLVLAACQGAASPSPSPTTAPTEAPTATEAPSGTVSGEIYTVNVGMGTVGDYLTGEDGKTLYVKQGDSTSATTCTGECLTAWPPFTLDEGETAVAGTGVSGTLATFTRPEGDTQVTYNGQPLYYFSGDTNAGDTNGQGIGGVWSVAAP